MSDYIYKEAVVCANKPKNAGKVYTGDAGNGCRFEMYYCLIRKRRVACTITPDGTRIY